MADERQDVVIAIVRARRAIAKARAIGGGANHTTDAVEKLCDALDGVLGALMAEPSLRIDYLHALAPAPLAPAPAPAAGREGEG